MALIKPVLDTALKTTLNAAFAAAMTDFVAVIKASPAKGNDTEALNLTAAIASSSLVTEWVKGKTINEAAEIKNTDITAELELPPVKIHCSILAEDAIKAAITDYKTKHNQ